MTTVTEPGETRTHLRTWRATTAGILTIIAGAFEIAAGITMAVFGSFFDGLGAFYGFDWGGIDWTPFLVGGGIAYIAVGIVAIFGGRAALRRSNWGLALAGAILALLTPMSSVLGILSIIFVSMARNEFGCECCR